MTAAIRAFRVTVHEYRSIVFATSPGQARFASWSAAREAGYRWGFGDFKVRRAPEFDGARVGGMAPEPRVSYSESHVIPRGASA